ncbi:hypothetical protein PUN28_000992 [Cardiocondyla obscurior]|uniref:Uncharacterized protein n=1 Tax=Cardiocondyla obscurior TaxID=286306 RepID=A0AAW2H2C8_9HYME
MKHFALLCILFILVHFSTQTPKYENCPENVTKPYICDCCKVTCSLGAKGDLNAIGVACPAVMCAPGSIYYEDESKQYPDCCGNCTKIN